MVQHFLPVNGLVHRLAHQLAGDRVGPGHAGVIGRVAFGEIHAAQEQGQVVGGDAGLGRLHSIPAGLKLQFPGQGRDVDFAGQQGSQPGQVFPNPPYFHFQEVGVLAAPVRLGSLFKPDALTQLRATVHIRAGAGGLLVKPFYPYGVELVLAQHQNLAAAKASGEDGRRVEGQGVEGVFHGVIIDSLNVARFPEEGSRPGLRVFAQDTVMSRHRVMSGELAEAEVEGHALLQVEGPLPSVFAPLPALGQAGDAFVGLGVQTDQGLGVGVELVVRRTADGPVPVGLLHFAQGVNHPGYLSLNLRHR